MKIETVKDFGNALKQGPYAWPGGYPLFFVTSDGGALAFGTAWEERANIAQAILNNDTRWMARDRRGRQLGRSRADGRSCRRAH